MELTFFDIIPAPALRFRSRTMLHSITINSSSCLGWHKLLKGWLQKVLPSISATKNTQRALKNKRTEVFQKPSNAVPGECPECPSPLPGFQQQQPMRWISDTQTPPILSPTLAAPEATWLTGYWCPGRVSGLWLWGGRAKFRTLVHQKPPDSTWYQTAKTLPEISISTLRPSSTQRPASYSAGHPMPNN